MAGRYEISDNGWALIEDIVSPPQRTGRPRRDDRQVLNGIFWILCSGAKWRDLPERYGPWKTVYDRFRQWRDDGTFEAILAPHESSISLAIESETSSSAVSAGSKNCAASAPATTSWPAASKRWYAWPA